MKLKNMIKTVGKDLYFWHIFPRIYNKEKKKPVDEKKVLFVQLHQTKLNNSFQMVYQELKRHSEFDLHIHYLQQKDSSRKEYLRRCKALVRDLATAKYVFLEESSDVISCIDKRPETFVTQLWHGCGAFKKFGMSTAKLLFGPDAAMSERHPYYKNLDLVTVSSPEVIWAYQEAMNLKTEKEKAAVRALGVSRSDIFYQAKQKEQAKERLYEVFPGARGKKVILYAPTFRGSVGSAAAPDQLDVAMFANRLEALGYVLVIKHHPYVRELPAIAEEFQGRFAYDATNTLSIEDLLFVSDICISDYSSLVFEYSIFERPMLFFAYDRADYNDWRGFYYDYEDMTPGPICETNEELIDQILQAQEQFDPAQVRAFRKKFMSACDGHATERILQVVMGKGVLNEGKEL